MSKKNSNEIIGNGNHDLPGCSTVSLTTALPRALTVSVNPLI